MNRFNSFMIRTQRAWTRRQSVIRFGQLYGTWQSWWESYWHSGTTSLLGWRTSLPGFFSASVPVTRASLMMMSVTWPSRSTEKQMMEQVSIDEYKDKILTYHVSGFRVIFDKENWCLKWENSNWFWESVFPKHWSLIDWSFSRVIFFLLLKQNLSVTR